MAIATHIGDRIEQVKATKTLVAAGASENMIPFPGWTLPGVIGAGAAQTMANIHGIRPGNDILMVGSGMAALGATCNDNKDAQSLTFPGILPAIIPMFLIMPVIANPTGPMATTMALIPPFTPTIMIMRLASPVTIPIWQPMVGLIGVTLFTIFTVWIGARVFRTAILIQGQKPPFATLYKYAFKG